MKYGFFAGEPTAGWLSLLKMPIGVLTAALLISGANSFGGGMPSCWARQVDTSREADPQTGAPTAGESVEEPSTGAPQDSDPTTTPAGSMTPDGLSYSDPVTVKWKVGVRILAGATDVHNLYIAIPVPCDWPEQTVVVDSEEMPPSVGNVTYAMLEGGVRRQLIIIPVLQARELLELTTVFRVETRQINGPQSTGSFIKPDPKNKEWEIYLSRSKYISFDNSKLREQAATLAAQHAEVWKQIESVYDWVRDHIDQKEMPNTDSIKTFRKLEGSEEDKVALFVALCRSLKVPARMIWVDGGCYAEFMLVDAADKAHWFPCNVTGLREFGSISEPRIILQKGDHIKVPEKNTRQKFVAEHMSCKGATRPVVEFVRELLPDEK